MAAFDHVVLLLSFVYALALTHVLLRIGALMQARQRVRFSGLLALAMGNAMALLYLNWLGLWDMRGTREWTLFSITMQFAFAVSQYFLCALVAPEPGGEGAIDLDAYYWVNRRPIYWTFIAVLFFAIAGNITFLATPKPELFLKENAFNLFYVAPVVLPLATQARWAQWVGGAGIALTTIGFLLLFMGALH